MSYCPAHGFYIGTSCTLCQLYGKGPMLVQAGTQYSVHDVHGNRKEWFVPDPELTMKAPTEAQLKDPKWWDENAPEGAEWLIDGSYFVKWIGAIEHRHVVGGIEWREAVNPWPKSKYIQAGSLFNIIRRPTKPPAPEWDGEGLPPEGCVCELSVPVIVMTLAGPREFPEGTRVTVGGHCTFPDREGPRTLAGVQLEDTVLLTYGSEHTLRPLRTKEQLDRDSVIAQALNVALHPADDEMHPRQYLTDCLDALYDAGMLRKVEQ